MKLNKPYKTNLETEEWLALRQQFVTATEAAAVLGVHPYTTASKLLKDKALPPKKIESEYLDRGLENEDSILQYAADQLDGKLAECQGFYANPETKISATPDGILEDGRLIEAKCTGFQNHRKWTEYPPLNYIMQCQIQMYVTGARENYLSARFFLNWPTKECIAVADRIYKIKYNEEIISKCIDKVKEFWYCLNENKRMTISADEKKLHTNILKSSCEVYKGEITMEKIVIPQSQLSIVRQNALKAACKMCIGLGSDAVYTLASLIEEDIYGYIVGKLQRVDRDLFIAIGAAINAYVEGHHHKDNSIAELKDFVIGALKHIHKE